MSGGAQNFVTTNFSQPSIQLVRPDELVAPRAKDDWSMWKDRLTSESVEEQMTGLYDLQDTVGAVAWVEEDGTAAAVSR